MAMNIQNIRISFENHPLVNPFKIGDKPAITDITRLVVTVVIDGIVGIGQSTLANIWADEDLERMKTYALVLQERVRETRGKNPLEVYNAMMPTILADSGINNVAKLICYAGFDLALLDAFGKKHGRHPCQIMGTYEKYKGLFLPAPRKQVYVEYTLGGVSPLLGNNGLLANKLRHGYRVVKVKCIGDLEKDFKQAMAVYAATGCRLWLDFNGAGNLVVVKQLCDALRTSLHQDVLLAVEQPFPTMATFDDLKVTDIYPQAPFFLDESAVLPEDVLAAKNLGYSGIVVKADKGGLSHVAEMARVARDCGMLISVQDLTSWPWASLGIAAHLVNLEQKVVELNQGQFLVDPIPVDIRNGIVDTSRLKGPGFYPK